MPKPTISYWKRYDLLYKKYSKKDLITTISNEFRRLPLRKKRGRPPIVRKDIAISYILVEKTLVNPYRTMELEGDAFLPHRYDHSSYWYQYDSLSEEKLLWIIGIFERKCKSLLKEIFFHILDSTFLSTSVRTERLRQGTRNKTKLTDKLHTMLGYDPPNKIVIVEATLASDHHLSDGKGGEQMLQESPKKGYLFGDSAYETYGLTELGKMLGLEVIIKPTRKEVRKKLSTKAQLRKVWNGNHSRLYKNIRGTGEVLYGAATRCGLIHTHCILEENRRKDSLILNIRQNVLSYLRLIAWPYLLDKLGNPDIERKTMAMVKIKSFKNNLRF